MVLELSTGGSVQDMLEDSAKAPGGQLPVATVRPGRQITCFDQAFLVLDSIRHWLTQSIETNAIDDDQCEWLCASAGPADRAAHPLRTGLCPQQVT